MKSNVVILILAIASTLNAQKYFTKAGDISFYSHTPLEDIEAESQTATSVIDLSTGQMQWAVLIKSFEFEKALMQEHFNENYMESSKYPKAKFTGKMVNANSIDFSKDGEYKTKVEGELEIHGVAKTITTDATFTVKGGKIIGSSQLKVLLADYGIEVPSVVKDNIAKEITITITADYASLDKS